MLEKVIKEKILRAANRVDMLSAMRLNRHERRGLSRRNGGVKILGSVKPYFK